MSLELTMVTDHHLAEISRSHCKNWRLLPPFLEMETIIAEDIDRKQIDEDDKRYQFLCKWRQEKGFNATYNVLMRALQKIGSRLDADRVWKLSSLPRHLGQPSSSTKSASAGAHRESASAQPVSSPPEFLSLSPIDTGI